MALQENMNLSLLGIFKMTKGQSWQTCKYGVSSSGGDEMAYEIRRHGLEECYDCESDGVLALGAYPTHPVRQPNNSFKDVVQLHSMLIADELSKEAVKRLESRVESALACCRHCKFYESK